jgi:hypothetical protein
LDRLTQQLMLRNDMGKDSLIHGALLAAAVFNSFAAFFFAWLHASAAGR